MKPDGLKLRPVVAAANAWDGCAGLGSESFREVTNRLDFYSDNLALVEHLLSRFMYPEPHHQVLLL